MAVSKSRNRLGRVVFDVNGPPGIDASMRFRSLAVGVESNLTKDGAKICMSNPLPCGRLSLKANPAGLFRRVGAGPTQNCAVHLNV